MATESLDPLVLKMLTDATQYQAGLAEAQRSIRQMGDVAQQQSARLDSVTNSVRGFASQSASFATGMLSVMGLGSVFDTVKKSISLAAEFESNEVAFGTMLRSADAGKKLVNEIQNLAAVTPMTTQNLLQASKTLLQFGTTGENILPTLEMLGDLTGGDANRLNMMSLAFGQVMSKGRLMGQEVLQMVNVGFNPLQEISKNTGKSMGQLTKEMEQGKIGVNDVIRAMQSATGAGGQFSGMMDTQSKTLSGLFSTMTDNVQISLQKLGQSLIDELNIKGLIRDVAEVAGAFSRWFTGLSAGTKTAIASIIGVTIGIGALTVALVLMGKALTFATGGFSLVFVAVATAITTVVLGLAGLTAALGGVGATFGLIKEKALQAWEWLKPVRQALVSFFETVWETGVSLWANFKEFVVGVWNSIVGDASVNWAKVRDTIRDAILFAEFSLKNMGLVAGFVWASMEYGFVRWSETVKYFFTTAMPVMIVWLRDNWAKLFMDMLTLASEIFAALPAVLKGQLKIDDVVKHISEKMSGAFSTLAIPDRQIGQAERDAKKMMDGMAGQIERGFEGFRTMKQVGFGGDAVAQAVLGMPAPAAKKEGIKLGEELGGALKKSAHKEVAKFEHTLAGSAEALARIAEFQNKMAEQRFAKEAEAAAAAKAAAGKADPGKQMPLSGQMGTLALAAGSAVARYAESNTTGNLVGAAGGAATMNQTIAGAVAETAGAAAGAGADKASELLKVMTRVADLLQSIEAQNKKPVEIIGKQL